MPTGDTFKKRPKIDVIGRKKMPQNGISFDDQASASVFAGAKQTPSITMPPRPESFLENRIDA